MITFLQTYGFWFVLIALFILMMRMHGGHGGHNGHGMGGGCMGGMEHDHQSSAEPKSDNEQPRVIPYAENEYADNYSNNQQDQPRVREFPAEHTEGSDDKPLVITQHYRS